MVPWHPTRVSQAHLRKGGGGWQGNWVTSGRAVPSVPDRQDFLHSVMVWCQTQLCCSQGSGWRWQETSHSHQKLERSWTLESPYPVKILAGLFTSSVTLDKHLYLSEPQFPHL